ncbi:hypothetical protein [Escherichia coli]|nr:hypothetical protein [Escherichia coli]
MIVRELGKQNNKAA